MTVYGYVRFETPSVDEREPTHYKMLDATVSIGINYTDTKHDFDDLAADADVRARVPQSSALEGQAAVLVEGGACS